LITAFWPSASTGACAPLDPSLTENDYKFYLNRLGARTLVVRDGACLPAISAARSLDMRVLSIQVSANACRVFFELADAFAANGYYAAGQPMRHFCCSPPRQPITQTRAADLV